MLESINLFSYLIHASSHFPTPLHICHQHSRKTYLLKHWTMLELINHSINIFSYLDHASCHLSTLLHICSHYSRRTCLFKHWTMLESINPFFLPWPCFLSSSHSPSYLSPSFQKNLPIKALNYVRINKWFNK